MNLCISINLKTKFQKYRELNIIKYEEYRLRDLSFSYIKKIISQKNVGNIIIEEKCIDNPNDIIKLLEYLVEFKVKIIVVGFSNDNSKYKYDNLYYVNVQFNNHMKYLMKISYKKYSDKLNKKMVQKSSNNEMKKDLLMNNKVDALGQLRKMNTKDIILGISLDRKVYATTYLLTYAKYLTKKNNNEIFFLEKEQSLIDIEKMLTLNKNNIKYQKFSIIDSGMLNSNMPHIVDLGMVCEFSVINYILASQFKQILVFTTDCLKVNESTEYIKALRLLKKYNNVIFINRKEIFDRKIQERIKFYNSKVLIKSIKKFD